jgi:hypothetical protein
MAFSIAAEYNDRIVLTPMNLKAVPKSGVPGTDVAGRVLSPMA